MYRISRCVHRVDGHGGSWAEFSKVAVWRRR
jgi:hypothetical protein